MYRKILVPLDGSELAECVLPHVKAITEGCKVPEVVLVRVVEPVGVRGGDDYALSEEHLARIEGEGRKGAREYLDNLLGRFRISTANLKTELLAGSVAESIVDYASKSGADLIVMATHGRSGVSRWVWGSVADRLLRASCVPVLMVRAPGCVPGL